MSNPLDSLAARTFYIEVQLPSWSQSIHQKEATNMAGILDLDINAITDPNQPAPAGKYRLVVKSAERSENAETGSVGAKMLYQILTPGEHQGKQVRQYINVIKKDGTENKLGSWQVKTFITMKGIKKGKLLENVPHLVGLEFDAELEIEEPEEGSQYGPQNVIKRVLQ